MTAERTFILVHSPLVGPSTWRWVAEALRAAGHRALVPSMLGFEAAGPPYWPQLVDELVAACPSEEPVVLVGHSGAGPLLPIAAAALDGRATHVVFAEASIPPVAGPAPLAPPWLIEHLRPLAVDGVLPPWSAWWGEGALESLVPDVGRREALASELPRLPLAYLEQSVPVEAGWADRVAPSFLWFSDVYEPDAADATERGWPVHRLPGGHLHMAVDPAAVADALIDLTR